MSGSGFRQESPFTGEFLRVSLRFVTGNSGESQSSLAAKPRQHIAAGISPQTVNALYSLAAKPRQRFNHVSVAAVATRLCCFHFVWNALL